MVIGRQGLRRTLSVAVLGTLVLISGFTGARHSQLRPAASIPATAPAPEPAAGGSRPATGPTLGPARPLPDAKAEAPDAGPVPAPMVSPAIAEAVAAESARKNQPPAAPEPKPEPTPAPAVTPQGGHLKRIPVLMYHEIGDKPNNNYIRRTEFEAQMKWLKENGYTAVTLGAAYRNLKEGKPIPLKPVAVTFDDGYVTFYTIAAPIMKQYGFRATNFIITGLVGQTEQMNWAQVEELAADGFEMGAHTVTHPDLRSLSGDALRRQLVGSKQELEKHIGKTAEFFAYPAGRYNQETLAAVKTAGFLAAVTTDYGTVTPETETTRWPRVRISRGETEAGFASKIKSASEGEGP